MTEAITEQIAELLARMSKLETERNQKQKPAICQDDPPSRHYGLRSPIIEPPLERLDYEVKASMIHLVKQHQFNGLANENPIEHIESFETLCSTTKAQGVPPTYNHCKLFQFSLAGKAEKWFKSLTPNSLDGWEETRSAFIDYFFSKSKTAILKQKISTFKQSNGESFNETWERFKEYQRDCPHHGFTEQSLLEIFYEGVNRENRTTMNAASRGSFMKQSLEDAYLLIENLADSAASENKECDRSHKVNSIDQNKIDELIDSKLARLLTSQGKNEGKEAGVEQDISYVNGQVFKQHQGFQPRQQATNASGSQDKIERLLGRLVLEQEKTEQRLKAVYNDLNGKFEALATHAKNLDTQVAQTTETIGIRQETTHADQKEPCKMVYVLQEQLDKVEKLVQQLMIRQQESEERWNRQLAEKPIDFPPPTNKGMTEQQDKAPATIKPRTAARAIEQPEPVYTPPIPYPVTPKHQRPSVSLEKLAGFQEMVRRIPKKISFEEAWEDRPLWTFFKDSKETQEDVKALFHEVRGKAPPLRTLQKKGDPGQFIVPFSINGVKFEDTLCDSGSSINLMSKDLADELQLTNLQPSKIRLAFADSSTAVPEGKLVDINIRIGDCLVPTDFQVIKMKNTREAPLLLGRPFMATAGALMDLPRNRISFLNINRKVFYDVLPNPGSTQHSSCIHIIESGNRSSLSIPKQALGGRTDRNPKLQPPDIPWHSSHHLTRVQIPIPHEVKFLGMANMLDKTKGILETSPDITSWKIDKDAPIAPTSR